ncbi:hypothetical protein FKM82_007007 [Ascaphus truei]
MAAGARAQLEVHAHHEQQRICDSRAKYREGRRPRAVKVYTINLESRYLLVQGVPAIGVMKELIEQFALYGTIEEYNALDEYPAEEFTEVYLIKFQRLQSARVAKRKLDERSFFGGLLHLCYAPEFETVQETREKLQERRKLVAKATSDRAWHVTEKKQEVAKNVTQTYESGFLEPGFNDVHTSSCTPHPHLCDPLESCFVPTPCRAPAFPREHIHSSFSALQNTSREASRDTVHQTPSCSNVTGTWQSRRTSVTAQCRPNPPDNGIVRFMPRTAQLQERQRKREKSNALALCGSSPDSEAIVIGPRLPEIPKVDMDDNSLNVSANLIRVKLKEVSAAPINTTQEKDDIQTIPPKKQRRRI